MSNISKRGFASMAPDKRRELASKGGKAAWQSGGAHRYTTETAREAGRKGGMATAAKRKAAP